MIRTTTGLSQFYQPLAKSSKKQFILRFMNIFRKTKSCRPKFSTEIALTHFTDAILEQMDKGQLTGAVFLDLSKAFDTVDHTILFSKLCAIGLSDNVICWFNSYLSNRKQVTSVANSLSTTKPVAVGVPQGSVLGPLLFIIFVNDLPLFPRYCETALYADDKVLYCHAKDPKELASNLNHDLQCLFEWFNTNLLTLNTSKCKFIIFGSPRKLKNTEISIKINQSALEKVDSYKYLGVTVNQRMNWTDHIDSIISKIGQRLGLVRRVKHLLPKSARLTLYNSLIMPLFDYADIVWGDKNNVQLMNHLQVMQNNAARLILDFPARASGTQALELLKWQPLHLRRFYHRCLMVFKYKNGNVDFNFGVKKNNELHGYSTRRRNDYHLPKVSTNWGKQMFKYCALNDWNSLELGIRESSSLFSFKSKMSI